MGNSPDSRPEALVEGSRRVVRFFEPVLTDEKDRDQRFDAQFWHDIRTSLEGLSIEKRTKPVRGRVLEGGAEVAMVPATSYFYVARQRPQGDWPEVSRVRGERKPLVEELGDARLLESAYLLPVDGTPYVAFLRLSGGPMPASVAAWLGAVLGLVEKGHSLALRPYVRHDQLQRMSSAIKATRIHLTLGRDVHFAEDDARGELGQALLKAQMAGDGGVSVDLTVSFGNSRAADTAGEALLDEFRRLVGEKADHAELFRKATATVKVPDKNGNGTTSDTVELVEERFAVEVVVPSPKDEPPGAEAILSAMLRAIDEFRDGLE